MNVMSLCLICCESKNKNFNAPKVKTNTALINPFSWKLIFKLFSLCVQVNIRLNPLALAIEAWNVSQKYKHFYTVPCLYFVFPFGLHHLSCALVSIKSGNL